jgi:N-acetylglutamate synthase-like GNAT family acetyltransferase
MIEYSTDRTISPEQLATVFDRSGIRRPTHDLARMQKMIAAADLLITAWDGEKLVGVSRSLTDFCFCCYLSDLAVDCDYQKQGVGRRLVELTREAIGDQTMLLLIAAPEAMDYYPKIGFEKLDRAWWINRAR